MGKLCEHAEAIGALDWLVHLPLNKLEETAVVSPQEVHHWRPWLRTGPKQNVAGRFDNQQDL